MFAQLKVIAMRLLRGGFPTLPPTAGDPFAGVREPRFRGPGGRSAGASVEEPREAAAVRAHAADRGERFGAR